MRALPATSRTGTSTSARASKRARCWPRSQRRRWISNWRRPRPTSNTAQANANNARIQADRYTGLVKSNAVSRQDTDTFVNQAAATAAAVHSAQANVERLRELQSFEKVYAPFDGVVTARNIDTGQLIDPGAGKELFHLQAIQTLRVYANLPQVYSSNVKPGAKIGLSFAEHRRQDLPRHAGPHRRRHRSCQPDAAGRNRRGQPRRRTAARLSGPGPFQDARRRCQLSSCPSAALIFRKEGLRVGVVVNGNVAHLVPVVIGEDDGANVQIVSGSAPGDQVIQDPPDSLIEGEKVQVEPRQPIRRGRQVADALAPCSQNSSS